MPAKDTAFQLQLACPVAWFFLPSLRRPGLRAPRAAAAVLDVGREELDDERADALLQQQLELGIVGEDLGELLQDRLKELQAERPEKKLREGRTRS